MRNKKPILNWFSFFAASLLVEGALHGADPDPAIRFNRDIRPILSDACYACHGPDKNAREAELRLDDRESAIEHGALVPGDPDASEIFSRVHSHDPESIMPPPKTGKRLTGEQIETIRRWIASGAEYEPHWAFVPVPQTIPIPEPPEAWQSWPRQPLDRFVLETILDRGMEPSEPADALRWLRRARFDLTGLPPTPAEVEEIRQDASEASRERLVDRWLASDAYGERMATLWLDVARYADTFGYQADVQMDVWPWRDWLIRAFTGNLPYDQFLTWQLAGDLLPDATDDQRLATAFNRLHRQTNEGGSIEEEFRQVYVADRTVTAGTAFLGLTLECSRCHDHKYDPIPQKSFYSLAAYFADIDEHGLYSHFTRATPTPALDLYTPEQRQQHAALWEAIRDVESRRAEVVAAGQRAWEVRSDAVSRAGVMAAGDLPSTPWSFPMEGTESGVFGQATRFNGDDAVSFPLHRPAPNVASEPNDAAVPVDTAAKEPAAKIQHQIGRETPFSLSLWVKSSAHAPRVIVAHQSVAAEDSAFRGLQLVLEEGKPQFSLIHFWPGDAIRVEGLEPIAINEWTHLGVTYDGSSRAMGVQLFVDGQRIPYRIDRDQLTRDIRHRSEWGDANAGTVAFSLGARFRDIGFREGSIDQVHVFDRELDVLEMASLYASAPIVAEEQRSAILERTARTWDPRFLRGQTEYDALTVQLDELRRQENELVTQVRQVMAMRPAVKPRATYVLERGAYDAPRDSVSPRPLPIAPSPEGGPAQPVQDRLALARWMTADTNPLTSRVAVNRFWSLFFGRGIVASLEDFGSQGSVPSHPDLLDWLARDFMELGWDIKRFCKQIVLSETYRQASTAKRIEWEEQDPENRWLARGPRHRLSAESVRDAALFASGLLVPQVGGPSVMPYQPAGLWEESGTGKTYHQAQGEGLYRRSLYTFWRRTAPPPSMLAFDATSREVCTARRETTTTPLQALVMLNDPQFIEAARVLSEQVLEARSTDLRERFHAMSVRILGRPLSEREIAILEQTYREQLEYFQTQPDSANAFLAVGTRPANPRWDAIDLAATTVVAETLFCFDEFVMKR